MNHLWLDWSLVPGCKLKQQNQGSGCLTNSLAWGWFCSLSGYSQSGCELFSQCIRSNGGTGSDLSLISLFGLQVIGVAPPIPHHTLQGVGTRLEWMLPLSETPESPPVRCESIGNQALLRFPLRGQCPLVSHIGLWGRNSSLYSAYEYISCKTHTYRSWGIRNN